MGRKRKAHLNAERTPFLTGLGAPTSKREIEAKLRRATVGASRWRVRLAMLRYGDDLEGLEDWADRQAKKRIRKVRRADRRRKRRRRRRRKRRRRRRRKRK